MLFIGGLLWQLVQVKGTVGLGVGLHYEIKIKDDYLSRLPFGIGNFITKTHEIDVPLYGIPLKDYKVEIPANIEWPFDWSVKVGPSAEVFAGSTASLSFHLSIKKVKSQISMSNQSATKIGLYNDNKQRIYAFQVDLLLYWVKKPCILNYG